jgi:hypothetical protein
MPEAASIVLNKPFDALRRRLSPTTEVGVRLRDIDAWLDALPLPDARAQALDLINKAEWFTTDPGDGSAALPPEAPPTVRELYARYRLIRGRFCDLRLVATDCAVSTADPSLLRIGWDDAHVELCTGSDGDVVYRVANDVPPDEAREGALSSVYHAILRVGAILEYVTPPPAAA